MDETIGSKFLKWISSNPKFLLGLEESYKEGYRQALIDVAIRLKADEPKVFGWQDAINCVDDFRRESE